MSLLLHLLPGLLVLAAARLPRVVALAGAPVASSGVLAVAIAWTTWTGVDWGVLPAALTAVVLALLCGGVAHVLGRGRSADPPRRAPVGVLGVATAFSVCASWWFLRRGIGRPDALQQSHDAAYHLNALARVLAAHDAGWFVVGRTSSPASDHTFYPSGLHAHAALVAQLTGDHPVVVLNVVMLVLAAVVWPASMVLLTWQLVERRAAPLAVALLLPVTLVFPVLLLHFGVLWSNAAAVALAPGLVSLVALVCDPRRRVVRRAGWLLPTGLSALGLGLVHPAGLLSVIVLVAPLVVAQVWRQARSVARRRPELRRRMVVVGALAVGLLVAGAVVVGTSGTARRLMANRTRTVTTGDQAFHEILTIGTHLTPGWLTLALLALVGAVAVMRRSRAWLVVAWVLVAATYVLAASADQGWGAMVTALWDREPYRVVAPIAIPTLVLAGSGAAALVSWGARLAGTRARIVVPVVGALVAAAVLAGWPSGSASAVRLVAHNYGDQEWWRTVISTREATVYEDTLGPRQDGLAVIGDPFGGGQWAGVLSGHPTVYAHFGGVYTAPYELLRGHFREMTPAVCAAVRELHVGYAVEDTDRVWDNDPRFGQYVGLRGLAHVRGLERIGGSGTVSVYRITGCGPISRA